jgi:hypothetical protein
MDSRDMRNPLLQGGVMHGEREHLLDVEHAPMDEVEIIDITCDNCPAPAETEALGSSVVDASPAADLIIPGGGAAPAEEPGMTRRMISGIAAHPYALALGSGLLLWLLRNHLPGLGPARNGMEKARSLSERGSEVISQVGDQATTFGSKVADMSSKALHGVKDRAASLGSSAMRAGGKVLSAAKDQASSALSAVAHKGSDLASQATSMGGSLLEKAKDKGGEMLSSAAHGASQAAGNLRDRVTQGGRVGGNPLAMGMACAGLGAIVGLLVPETESEIRLLSPARETVIGMANQKVSEITQELRDVSEQVVEQATEGVRQFKESIETRAEELLGIETEKQSEGQGRESQPLAHAPDRDTRPLGQSSEQPENRARPEPGQRKE